jgi:conjugative relaxase-like TrwC/TraI family protein
MWIDRVKVWHYGISQRTLRIMLRITTSRGHKAATNYYASGLKKQDYYARDDVASRWRGKLAEELNLSGKITGEDFAALARNRHPETGTKLSLRDSPKRRVGYDFTYNAPKSVSVLYELNGDQDILDAHRNAVAIAMQAVERDAQTLLGKGTQKELTTTGELIWGEFDHYTSRPTASAGGGKPQSDPALHTHAFVFNYTRDPRSGKYRALEMGGAVRNAPYYQALYHGHLSAAMRKAGYPIERKGRFWEVAKFSPQLKAKFSTRSAEIETAIQNEEQKGKTLTDKQKAAVGARTRNDKAKETYSPDELRQKWQERLSPTEAHYLATIKGSSTQEDRDSHTIDAKTCVRHALDHHLERKSAVPEKKMLAEAMRRGYGQITPDAIEAAATQNEDILRADRHYGTYITTRQSVHVERTLIRDAVEGKNTCTPLNTEYKIKTDFLNDQQRQAVQELLTSKDRITLLNGAAGVGKSTLLAEVKAGIEEQGLQVHAFAPSAEASRKVLRDKGFDDADTIARFLLDKERQEAIRNQVVLVDESGMVGAETLARLTAITREKNARLILSGDTRQHNSVEAGDAMHLLATRAELPVTRVEKIVRQRTSPKYQKAVEALAKGDTARGFDRLDRAGAITEIADREKRNNAVATAYLESIEAGRSALVVSPTHREGNEISQTIRGQLKDKSRLKGIEHHFNIIKSLSMTTAQKTDPASYQQGQIIRFHQNAKGGFKAGNRYRVEAITKNGVQVIEENSPAKAEIPLLIDHQHASRFEVFRADKLPICSGEKIRVTAGGRTKDGARINNGTVVSVSGFTKAGDIKLANGNVLDKSFGTLSHGYTRTSHAAQGRDAKDVIIAQSSTSLPASSDKQFYVSASRGVETCRIFTDDKTALKEAIQRSAQRVNAVDIEEGSKSKNFRPAVHNEKKNRRAMLERHQEPTTGYENSRQRAIETQHKGNNHELVR